MKKLSVYRTLSFWFCLGMAWVNMVMILVAMRLHSTPLLALHGLTFAVCMVGALAHWYLEKLHGSQSQRRR